MAERGRGVARDDGYQSGAAGHRGSRAVERLVEYAPASGALALWMRHRDVDAPPAPVGTHRAARGAGGWLIGNDGRTLWYGPAFERRALPEQTALVAHQVLHVALRHAARERALRAALGDVDPTLWNLAADAIVDAALSHLGWLALPADAVPLDVLLARVLGEEDASVDTALLRWDVESLYRALDDRRSDGAERSPRATRRGARGGSDEEDEAAAADAARERPGEDGNAGAAGDGGEVERTSSTLVDGPIAAAARALAAGRPRDLLPDAGADAPEREADHARAWSERLLRAHAADGAQSLLRQLLADRPAPRTPWEPLLRTRIARALAEVPELSWSRPTRSWLANRGRTANGRRLPWQPGTSGTRAAPRLVVIVDVSGSIAPAALGRFSGELERLMRVHRATIDLVIGDDRVREERRLRPGCRALLELELEVAGGGGTDFRPLLAAAGERRPDLVIVLTDLEGPAGDAPPWPVIWALLPPRTARPAPFGRAVVLG